MDTWDLASDELRKTLKPARDVMADRAEKAACELGVSVLRGNWGGWGFGMKCCMFLLGGFSGCVCWMVVL